MDFNRTTFSKNERLSWKRQIDVLFAEGMSFISYPLRIIYLPVDEAICSASKITVLISVPKKKIRHAVDRNYIKRRIRESYRLQKHDLIPSIAGKNKTLLIAFLYLDRETSPFEVIHQAMTQAIRTLGNKMG